jgi:hypothetical protein
MIVYIDIYIYITHWRLTRDEKMSFSALEILPVNILFEIFDYLSPVDVLQSFVSLNEYFLRIIICEYLWHIHIGDLTISLSMFNDFCQNVLKLIGSRVVSLRVRLTDVIGGWSIVSSSLQYHQITLLQRLHLIDIKPHEFDKLLRSRLMKQLHILLVDLTKSSLFHDQIVEGVYLAKVKNNYFLNLLRYLGLIKKFF